MWIILAFLAALFQALFDALNKKYLSYNNDNEIVLCFGTFLVSSILLLPLALFNIPTSYDPKILILIPIAGILDSLAILCYMKSIKTGALGDVIPLQISTPIFALLTAPLLLNESLTIPGILGVILVVFGAYCLNIKSNNKSFLAPFKQLAFSKESRYMLTTAILWSITTCFHKIGMQSTNTFFWIFFVRFPLFVFFYIYAIRKISRNPFSLIKDNFSKFTLLGFINAAIAFLYYISIYLGVVVYAMAIKRTSVIISIALGAILYHEINFKQHLVGAVIMLLGCIFVTI